MEKEKNNSARDHAGTNIGNISLRSLPNQTISSFIGRTPVSRTTNTQTAAYTDERTFYNLFGDLAKIFREPINSGQQNRLTQLLEEFLVEQHPDTIDHLRKINSADFLNRSARFEKPQPNVSENISVNVSSNTAGVALHLYNAENIETDEEIVSITQNMKPNIPNVSRDGKGCSSTQTFNKIIDVNSKTLENDELNPFANVTFDAFDYADLIGFKKEIESIADFYKLDSMDIAMQRDQSKKIPKHTLDNGFQQSSTTIVSKDTFNPRMDASTLRSNRLNPYMPQVCSKFHDSDRVRPTTSGLCQQQNTKQNRSQFRFSKGSCDHQKQNEKVTMIPATGPSIPLNVKKEVFPAASDQSKYRPDEFDMRSEFNLEVRDRPRTSLICGQQNMNVKRNRSTVPKNRIDRQMEYETDASISSSDHSIPPISSHARKKTHLKGNDQYNQTSHKGTEPFQFHSKFQPGILGICRKRNPNAIYRCNKSRSDRQEQNAALTLYDCSNALTSSNAKKEIFPIKIGESNLGKSEVTAQRSYRSVSVQFPESICTESIEIKSIVTDSNQPILKKDHRKLNTTTISTNSILFSPNSSDPILNCNQDTNQDLETISLSSDSPTVSDYDSCIDPHKKRTVDHPGNELNETINMEIDNVQNENGIVIKENEISEIELSTISDPGYSNKNSMQHFSAPDIHDVEMLDQTQVNHDHHESSSLYPEVSNNSDERISESVSKKTMSTSSTLRKFHIANKEYAPENETSTDSNQYEQDIFILPPPPEFS